MTVLTGSVVLVHGRSSLFVSRSFATRCVVRPASCRPEAALVVPLRRESVFRPSLFQMRGRAGVDACPRARMR